MSQPTDREQTIQGLRELADFLEANPDVPIDPSRRIQYSVDANVKSDPPGARRAEVDRIAKILGVLPRYDGRYTAERDFGGVVYVVASINPGPKQGWCAICRSAPVRAPGTDGLAGKLCTPCLGDQADLIDPQGGAS